MLKLLPRLMQWLTPSGWQRKPQQRLRKINQQQRKRWWQSLDEAVAADIVVATGSSAEGKADGADTETADSQVKVTADEADCSPQARALVSMGFKANEAHSAVKES